MLMGWRKVLRIAESVGDFCVMEQIGRIYGLPRQISELVRRHDDLDPQLYLGWREELEDAFLSLSFRSQFDTFTERLPRTLLVNLEFCSNALSQRCPEPVLDAEQIAGLATAKYTGKRFALNLGFNVVGNGPPTSQFGGTGWAGDVLRFCYSGSRSLENSKKDIIMEFDLVSLSSADHSAITKSVNQ